MTTNEWLTLLAIVLGPIIAVCITLYIEHRRKTRDRRIQIVRMLLSTRHIPADGHYCAAVNLIPADFNDQPKVMEAWHKYIEVVSMRPAERDVQSHQKRTYAAQSTLIFQAMRSAGLELSEADIQTEAYVSQAFMDRDQIYMKSLTALSELAEVMKTQSEYTRLMVERIYEQAGKPMPQVGSRQSLPPSSGPGGN